MTFFSGRGTKNASPRKRFVATSLALLLALAPAVTGSADASETAPLREVSVHNTASATDWRIHIVRGSDINLVATASRVPIQIRNDYDTDIRVLIWSQPSNLRVTMPKAIAFTAPANTTSNATIPVQAIANGEVRLNVWLTSFSGVRLGHPEVLNMSVQRDIEGSILIGFFVVVGTLGFMGARRMMRRRAEANS
jgi:hypothetical protein